MHGTGKRVVVEHQYIIQSHTLCIEAIENTLTCLSDADPISALEVLALHAQPRGLVGIHVELLVASRGAAGGDGLLEPAAALDLESTDALVPLVELDVEVDNVLGLFEPIGDLALGVVELLAARPPGGVDPVLVASEGRGAAVRVASPV